MEDLTNEKKLCYDLVAELEADEQKDKEEKILARIIADQNPDKDPESFYPHSSLYNPFYRKIAEKGIKKEWLNWKLPVKSLNEHLKDKRTDQKTSKQ